MSGKLARRILPIVIGGLLLMAAPPSNAQRPKPKPRAQMPQVRVYSFDAQASEIIIILKQEGLMRSRYAKHRVAAKSFNGRVELPADEAKMFAEVNAETKMLANIDEGMSDFERKEFHASLRGPILEADKFPTIKFTSAWISDLQKDGDRRSFTLGGDLTLHGVTRRVAFPVSAAINQNELRATGEAKLKQSDYGIKPFEKGLGLVKVADELQVSFSVVAKL